MDWEPSVYIFSGCIGLSIVIASIGEAVKMMRGKGGQKAAAAKTGQDNNGDLVEALKVYKELPKDKLDVINTALAMGYKDEEIARLDARLENLIGLDKVEKLLKGASPEALASADLLDTQLENELRRLKQIQDSQ